MNKTHICRGAISGYPKECMENKEYKACYHCKPHSHIIFCESTSGTCGICIQIGSLEYEMLKIIKDHEGKDEMDM